MNQAVQDANMSAMERRAKEVKKRLYQQLDYEKQKLAAQQSKKARRGGTE